MKHSFSQEKNKANINRINELLQYAIMQVKQAGIPASDFISPEVVINSRAKSRLGACRLSKSKFKKHFTIEIGSALMICSEREITEVLVHEVIHTCPGCMNHGEKWKKYAACMNKIYGYDIKRLYDIENTKLKEATAKRYKYRITCESCGAEMFRQRNSKVIKDIKRYRCRCGGKLKVENIVKKEDAMNKIADMSIKDYLDLLKTDAPAPGGGSVSGITACQGMALALMVTELTIGKKKYEEVQKLNKEMRAEALEIYGMLLNAADEDKEAFTKLSEAYKLPKDTDEEKAYKRKVLGEKSIGATEAPFKVMKLSMKALEITKKLVGQSNKMASSDLGVAAVNLYAACSSAWLNVKINLPYLTDEKKAAFFEKNGLEILEKARILSEEIYKEVEENL